MGETHTLAAIREILWPENGPRLTYRDRKAAALDTLESVELAMVRGGWGPLPGRTVGGPGRLPQDAEHNAAVHGGEPCPDDDDRCPHGMFYSGAGSCPMCSATDDIEQEASDA